MTQNEEMLIHAIRERLTRDMLDEKFLGRPESPFFGHCFHASVALYRLLGGKEAGYSVWKAMDCTDTTHYWVTSPSGEILDPTVEQYTDFGLTPPYDSGRRTGFRVPNAAKDLQQAIEDHCGFHPFVTTQLHRP